MWPIQTKSALAGKLCGNPPSPHTAVRGQGLGATASFASWLPVGFHQSGCSRDSKHRKGERTALSNSVCCSCLQQPRSWLMGPAFLTLFFWSSQLKRAGRGYYVASSCGSRWITIFRCDTSLAVPSPQKLAPQPQRTPSSFSSRILATPTFFLCHPFPSSGSHFLI